MSQPFFAVLRALLRSSTGAWLLGAMVVQILITSTLWGLQIDHLPLTGVLLMAIAAWRSPSTDRFVWRVLPIAPSALALARWSVMGPATGLAMTAALALAAYNNHSFGFPAPALGPQLLAVWSALGYLVWLPANTKVSPHVSVPRLLGAGLVAVLALLCVYGYRLRPDGALPSYALMALGYLLLMAAPLRLLLWPTGHFQSAQAFPAPIPEQQRHPSTSAARLAEQPDAGVTDGNERAGQRFGWGVLIRPLLAHTAAMTLICIAAVSALRRLYPHATDLLSWAFLCAVAAWSVFLTRRWTHPLWVWRCLPLSSGRLAVCLRGLATLPAAVALLVAVGVNRLAPQAAIPLPGWLIVAFIGLQAIVDAQPRREARKSSSPHSWLLAETMRLTYPGYVAAALLALFALFTAIECRICSQVLPPLTWLPNVIAAVAALLLLSAYAITHSQLTSGSERER